MADEYDFADKSEQEILLSYVANKGHRTRNVNKINNLLDLQDAKYSKITEATLVGLVSALERYQDRLNIFVAWLELHELASAEDHRADVEILAPATVALVNRVMQGIHDYEPPVAAGVGGAGQLVPLQAPAYGPTAKPVMALKPEKLGFDSNLGQVRRWKQRFRAFHASSNLRIISIPDQQAYLIACIDDKVANRIHRLVTETTPLFPNQAQIPCCYDVIDSLFEEKIPLLLRRVQFIANKQQDGQDGISWREELRNLADDAAIEDMETADLLCVIYVTGIKNDELREKLLEITDPTIAKFDRMVDSYDQAKKQLGEMKNPAAMATTQPNRGRQQQRNQRPNNFRRQEGRPEANKGRSGKLICFRCGQEGHIANACPTPAHLKCSKCGKQGHIRPACRQANAAGQQPTEDLTKQLDSLTVSNPPAAAQSEGMQTVHTLYSTAPNQPTPTVNL